MNQAKRPWKRKSHAVLPPAGDVMAKIVIPPEARYNPSFGNQPCLTWDDRTVVFDERFDVIYVVDDDGGCQQFESIEALYVFLKGD